MEGVLVLFAIVAAILALDVLAVELGVDSRVGFSDPSSPRPGISV